MSLEENLNREQAGRISVSEDRLRGVIAEFELRLRDFLAEQMIYKADLVMLNQLRKDLARLDERVENEVDELQRRVVVLEKWRYALGALATVALILGGYAAKYLTG